MPNNKHKFLVTGAAGFIGSEIMQMQFEAEKMSLEKRDTFIVDKLNEMVKNI